MKQRSIEVKKRRTRQRNAISKLTIGAETEKRTYQGRGGLSTFDFRLSTFDFELSALQIKSSSSCSSGSSGRRRSRLERNRSSPTLIPCTSAEAFCIGRQTVLRNCDPASSTASALQSKSCPRDSIARE